MPLHAITTSKRPGDLSAPTQAMASADRAAELAGTECHAGTQSRSTVASSSSPPPPLPHVRKVIDAINRSAQVCTKVSQLG